MEIKNIKLESIEIKDNFRASTVSDLSDLMLSIKENGLLHPLGVRRKDNKYELIFGNRRFMALKKLKKKTAPCAILTNINDEDAIVLNVVENIQRENTTMFEIGRAVSLLIEESNCTVEEIAKKLSTSKVNVVNALNVFKQTPVKYRKKVINMDNVTKADKNGLISSTVAIRINNTASRFGMSKKDLVAFYDYVSNNNVSAQGVEAIVKLMNEGMTLEQAINSKNKIKCFRVSLSMWEDEYNKLIEKYGKSFVRHLLMNQDTEKITPLCEEEN